MADAPAPGKGKEFFFNHGEKVGVGVAALLLLVFLALHFFMAGEDPKLGDLKSLSARIQQGPPNPAPDAALDTLRRTYPKETPAQALDPWNTISSSSPGPDWAGSLLTRLDVATKVDTKPTVTRFGLPKLTLKSDKNEVSLVDGVLLTWTQEPPPKEDEAVPVKELILERSESGGKFEFLAAVDPKGKAEYRDRPKTPKIQYSYRIVAKTDHAGFKEQRPSGLGDPSNLESVKTLGIWKFNVIQTQVNNEGVWTAYVSIEKGDPTYGPLKFPGKFYRVGDTLGVVPEKEGEGEPTGIHRTAIPGAKWADVDWDTKARIVKLEKARIPPLKKRVCEVKIGNRGERLEHEPQEILYKNFESVLIRHTDPDDPSKTMDIFFPDSKESSHVKDDLCEEHGGAKPRELEASKLNAEAEQFEKTGKKAEALKCLKELLSTYKDTDFVKQHQKAVEERIKRLGG